MLHKILGKNAAQNP
jgi:hypothetical protein